MTEDFEPSDARKVYTLINDGLSLYGSDTLLEILMGGEPDAGVEPLEGDARDVVEDWYHNDWGDQRAAKVWSNHPQILDNLKRLTIHSSRHRIQQTLEEGGLGSYLSSVATELKGLPRWVAADLLQEEVDRCDSSTYDHPEDWQTLIGLLQIEQQYNYYLGGRNYEENHKDRLKAWDELLKFTKYAVTTTYELPDGTEAQNKAEWWAQSEATAHNNEVALVPDEADIVNVEVTPIRRFQPGDVNDPLHDLEGFVFYEVDR